MGSMERGLRSGTPDGSFNTNAMFPAFAKAVAKAVEQTERLAGETFRIVEMGGGTGQLAEGILSYLAHPHEYVIVEPSPGLRHEQGERGLRSVFSATDLTPMPSFVFGNEVLDALPIHRVMGIGEGQLLEQFVGVEESGEFIELFEEPSTPALVTRLKSEGIFLGRGQVAEINLTFGEFLKDITNITPTGYVLFVDYGDSASNLYHYSRRNGSLRCFHAQCLTYDPFNRVGEQDLTCDVDFTAVESTALDLGFLTIGRISQGEWLKRLGISNNVNSRYSIRGWEDEVHTLTSSTALGSTFEVIAFKSSSEMPNIPGFSPP